MGRSRRLLVAGGVIASWLVSLALGACFPDYRIGSTADASSGDGGSDATSADALQDGNGRDVNGEGSSDGGDSGSPPIEASTDGGPVLVVGSGSKAGATGFGYQTHLVRAVHDQRWWLFYVDDTLNLIQTRASRDLLTWTSGGTIALPAGLSLDDGNDMSVAYVDAGGADIVHIAVNAAQRDADGSALRFAAYHIRATISGGAVSAQAPVPLPDTDSNTGGSNGSNCPQAGPFALVSSGGDVYDVSAWAVHTPMGTECDTNVYRSPGKETGTSWNASRFMHDGYFVSYPELTCSHDLIDLPEAGQVMTLFPDEDNGDPRLWSSFGWALSSAFEAGAGSPGTIGVVEDAGMELFNGNGTLSSWDDWASCRLADNAVHVLRHVIDNAAPTHVTAFEEVVYDGATWSPTTPPASFTSLSNSGLVLMSGTDASRGLLRAAIGLDNSIDIARWTTSSGWSEVATIPATATPRMSIAGTGCGSAHPVLLWTEGVAPPYRIMLADVSSLL